MNVEQRVRELVEEKIADREDLFIVDIKMHLNGTLMILIDGDNGIAIEDCAMVSRSVGFFLEEENVIEQAYHLEVSSPGIDYPLGMKRQYEKNVGRTISIQMVGEVNKKREGKLLEVQEEGILVEENIKEKGKKAIVQESFIAFDQITETKVLISFK